jgi:nascent polypeptide-associated complex subunit alpha
MFPGLGGLGGRGGMSPKKMKGMLKNMGIDIEELENVLEVVIRMPDREIVIENASVAIMDAHGTRSFQISGDARERSISENAPGPALETAQEEPELEILDSDVDLVVAQTGAKTEDAKAALIEAKGDLAAAIMSLAPK